MAARNAANFAQDDKLVLVRAIHSAQQTTVLKWFAVSGNGLEGVWKRAGKSFINYRLQDTIEVTVHSAATELKPKSRRASVLSVTLRTLESSKGDVAVLGAWLQGLPPLGKEGSW